MLCLNNDRKIQMRLNIQRHRLKLLQYLQNSNDNVIKPKIAESTELLNRKLEPTEVKNHKTRSTDTLNQLQPNINVNVKAELPSSNLELKQKSISTNENIDPLDPPEPIIKKLKEQLIEELYNSSSESEDIDDNLDDNISVGSNEDWSKIFQTDEKSNVYNNVSSNSIPSLADQYYEQSVNEKSKAKYSYNQNTGKKNQTRKSQHKSYKSTQRFRKPHDRSVHNAKERACREQIAKKFDFLRQLCSYLNSNRRVPSKHSILLAAKKECDLLQHFENKLIAEKYLLRKANDRLKERIANIINTNSKDDIKIE